MIFTNASMSSCEVISYGSATRLKTCASGKCQDSWRLTAERVSDAADALVYEHRFTYDAVGNRLAQERRDSSGTPELISYQYDERDRLLSETTAGISTTYGWDTKGNLSSVTTGLPLATFRAAAGRSRV